MGGGRSTKKKIRPRENEMKNNSCTPINPKKYKEFDNEKKFLRLEIPPPPPPRITFLMVRP